MRSAGMGFIGRGAVSFIFLFLIGTPLSAKESGLAFLKIGVGGREMGMGGAGSALARGGVATYWNPAGLAGLERSEIVFSHSPWILDIKRQFLAVVLPGWGVTFGMSANYLTVGGIEIRKSPTAEPIGTFTSRDVALGLSVARTIGGGLSAGLTLKYLYEKIYWESSKGVALDMGMLWGDPSGDLRLGLVGQNLGTMDAMKEERVALPTQIRMGIGYRIPRDFFGGQVLMGSDLIRSFSVPLTCFHSGMEYSFRGLLALRWGYRWSSRQRGITTGFGLSWGWLRLDYGYVPFPYDLGNTHCFSMTIDI
ncbi:PorV/PorQ family protein [candidate division KSB1 bacterium]|nr:PorV/PorQ family protein [candidate division KSB1 bacterium]